MSATPPPPPPPPGARQPPPPPPPPGAQPPPPHVSATPANCPHCGAALKPDQDWCLNCGAAVTTEIAGSRGWRAPVAIAGVVLVVAAAALVFAFAQLSNDADRVARAPTPTPTASAVPSATPTPGASATPDGSAVPGTTPTPGADGTPGAAVTPLPGASPTATPGDSPPAIPGADDGGGSGGIGSWPAGKSAYTVVLFSADTRSEAESKARGYKSGGTDVGILDSDDYSSLRGGYFVVFSGQYASLKAAQTAAEGLQSAQPGAYARQVKP